MKIDSFDVHPPNVHYLSIALYTFHRGHRFHETRSAKEAQQKSNTIFVCFYIEKQIIKTEDNV